MKEILIVSWHGLGDNVMMTPALRKLKQENPTAKITVMGLARFGEILRQLLSGLCFIDEVLPVLPDAWNDFGTYQQGIVEVKKEAFKEAERRGIEAENIKVCAAKRIKGERWRLHKIFRFAAEMGVTLDSLSDLQTELAVKEEADYQAREYLSLYRHPVLLSQTVAGNTVKTLSREEVSSAFWRFSKEFDILEFEKQIPIEDMEFSKALIRRADHILSIDSVVMHIAGAFCRPLTAIFTCTPVHQAIPLTYPVEAIGREDSWMTYLSDWPSIREEIMERFK